MSDGRKNNGGKRSGSGRKPKAYTQLRKRIEAEKVEEAEKSFDFYVQVRDNPDEKTEIRMAAADRIADRVLGKATQPVLADVRTSYEPGDIAKGIATILDAARLRATTQVDSESHSPNP